MKVSTTRRACRTNVKPYLAAACAIVLVLAALLSLYSGLLRFNYPDWNEYPVRGLDVSHHQKQIDWKTVSMQGFKFVYIKATEGGDFKDPRFAFNWREARAQGLATGAYHFYTFCRPGRIQAVNFITTVPYSTDSLPPAVDLEFGGNCSRRPNATALQTQLKIYLSMLRAHYKKTPVIYVTKEAYRKYIHGRYRSIPIWIRDIYFEPVLPEKRRWTFWQFANRGRVDGIDTPVDLNVFRGNTAQLLKLR